MVYFQYLLKKTNAYANFSFYKLVDRGLQPCHCLIDSNPLILINIVFGVCVCMCFTTTGNVNTLKQTLWFFLCVVDREF